MQRTIDLNADMGEAFGDWPMGNDTAMLKIVTSANIACGFHAGDPDVMVKTMQQAASHGVGIGAHPGLPDLQGFGRRRMSIPLDTLANIIRYQLGAAQAMAKSVGGKVSHFKLHGALSNMATDDPEIAHACFAAARDIDPDIIILVLAASKMQSVAEDLNCNWAAEIFADRAYNDDASLVDRSIDGSVIHDPVIAAKRIRSMVKESAIITETGLRIPTRIDTICVHGDTPAAVDIARAVRDGLKADGINLSSLGQT